MTRLLKPQVLGQNYEFAMHRFSRPVFLMPGIRAILSLIENSQDPNFFSHYQIGQSVGCARNIPLQHISIHEVGAGMSHVGMACQKP